MTCRFQVVVDLSTMLVGQGAYRLELEDKFSKTDQVRHVLVLQPLPFVFKYESRLGREIHFLQPQLNLKAFLEVLVEIGYDGPIRAEPFNRILDQMEDDPAVAETAKAMRKAFQLVGITS